MIAIAKPFVRWYIGPIAPRPLEGWESEAVRTRASALSETRPLADKNKNCHASFRNAILDEQISRIGQP